MDVAAFANISWIGTFNLEEKNITKLVQFGPDFIVTKKMTKILCLYS